MSEYQVEVYRSEVDDLTAKLTAVLKAEVAGMCSVDRSIIVAAALANVACIADGGDFDFFGATGRLSSIADMWRV